MSPVLYGVWMFLATTTGMPAGWETALLKGNVSPMARGRVQVPEDGFVKWVIRNKCVISLGPGTVAVFSQRPGEDCPSVKLLSGSIQLAIPVDEPVEVSALEEKRWITGVVTLEVVQGHLRERKHLPEPTPETLSGVSLVPVLQLRNQLISFLTSPDFSPMQTVQASSVSSGSACLDSRGSAGDVGQNSDGTPTQLPPASRLHIRVTIPGQVRR